MPETKAEFENICSDSMAWESDYDVLETIIQTGK